MGSQEAAESTMNDFESKADLWAMHRPAQRAPGSLEWRREDILADHFARWGLGEKELAESVLRTYERWRTEEESEASWSWSTDLS